jgi:predicted protein tyrosine phosphatase
MFEIKVSELDTADFHHNNWPATRVVSLVDPKAEANIRTHADRLIVAMSDVNLVNASRTPPRPGQIREILEFTKNLTDEDRVLVHCHAGVSRSTAMAIGILCQHGMSPSAALKHVQGIRPQLWPNTLIIGYIDEILDLKGELLRVVGDWLREEEKTMLWMPGVESSEEEKQANVDHMQSIMDKLKGLE